MKTELTKRSSELFSLNGTSRILLSCHCPILYLVNADPKVPTLPKRPYEAPGAKYIGASFLALILAGIIICFILDADCYYKDFR